MGIGLDWNKSGDGLVIALTGAGISAESGIPTFRGEEGYWTVGSEVYRPQELATHAAFRRMPDQVWQWYLYRRTVCRAAQPNAAHRALVELEEHLGDRFRLITQNVDGLHLRAGSSMDRTYQIHGNIDFMRCSSECSVDLYPIPEEVGAVERETEPSADALARLLCPRCGERSRPHVLGFDECYDEQHFRFESSLRAASGADLLLIVGTSASTNLPVQVVELAARSGATVVDINVDDNPFAQIARSLPRGQAVRGKAAAKLPALVEQIVAG
jgi:NAD-dependent deacetylase